MQEHRPQEASSLPSEGIIAIYQQFKQIWRRQSQNRAPHSQSLLPVESEFLKKSRGEVITPCSHTAAAA